MGSGDTSPHEEDWQLEWRWGAAHPWMRPKRSPASLSTSDTPSVASFSSSFDPTNSSPSSITSSSSFSPSPASSSCCNSSSSGSSLNSSRLPSRSSLFPSSVASCTCRPSSSVDSLQESSARQKACSIPTDSAASSSTATSTSLWPAYLSFHSHFRGATHALLQGKLIANAGPSVDASASSTRVASTNPATALAETPPAGATSAAAERRTELLPENGAGTAAACPVLLSKSDAGAEETRWVLQDGLQKTGAPVISEAGSLPPFRPLCREAASTAADESSRRSKGKASSTQTAESISEIIAGAGAARTELSDINASAAASATSTATARVDEKRDQQKFEKPECPELPKTVRQLLLQFGDQTLDFLQKQQVALWSFFAFRDWRVKTLVHALSAMGEPVNLVVVNCTPPPPTAVSSSSAASASASETSPASSSPSPSQARPSSGFPMSSSVPLSLSEMSAIPGPSVPKAPGAGGQRGQKEAALTTTAETEARAAGRQLALFRSMSPIKEEDVVRGGYSPLYHTVWLCGNRLWSPFELRRVLLHELVHAFDFARANLSPNDCRHVACTEIRAYNLSGQCGWWRTRSYDNEQFNTVQPLLLRKKIDADSLGSGQQQQQKETWAKDSGQWQQTKRNSCVMHGALNSLRQHRQCKAPGVAEDAVRDVFTRCIRDSWPFLVPPERDSRWRPSRMWRPEAAEFLKK